MLEKNEASPLKEVDRLTVLLLFLLVRKLGWKNKQRITSDLRPYEGLETKDDSGIGYFSIKEKFLFE